MNSDGKIYIIVTDKLPSGTTPTPEGTDNQAGTKDKEGLLLHWAKGRIVNLVKQTATQAAMYSFNNIGNFTGDYITQAHVDNALYALNSAMSIGTAALAGFKVAGPWGAVIGTSLEIVRQGVSTAFSIHSSLVQNRKTNYEIEQLRIRAGLNAALDGSRGTEN